MERLKINGIIILCALLYGCEAWSLKVTERIHNEGVQNRVQRQILLSSHVGVTTHYGF